MSQEAVRTEHVAKRFGRFTALKDISLSVPQGAFTTLLGPSGCGKTTLLRLIAGFYEPDEGQIFIDGVKMNGVPSFKRHAPLVFQDYALFPHMNVCDNVAYGLRLAKCGKADVARKVGEMLALFNLAGLEKRFPRQLSGGQQQRVAFARALVMGEKLLLLDEPLSNLDAKLRLGVREELKQIQKRFGITMVYVTHDQEEALSMSDHIAVMNKGEIEQFGAPQEIYRRPANRFVADFIGLANFIEADVLAVEGRTFLARCGGRIIRAACGEAPPRAGERVTLLLRPEDVSLRPWPGEEPAGENGLVGEVTDSSYLGRATRCTVKTPGATFCAESASAPDGDLRGRKVLLSFAPEQARLLPGTEA